MAESPTTDVTQTMSHEQTVFMSEYYVSFSQSFTYGTSAGWDMLLTWQMPIHDLSLIGNIRGDVCVGRGLRAERGS